MRPPIHNPTKPHCFLTQRASNPEASRTDDRRKHCALVGISLSHRAPATPVAGRAQCAVTRSPVRDETRISLPAKPSLTLTTLGQLCVTPWTPPAATEPGLEPRVSGGTAPPGRPQEGHFIGMMGFITHSSLEPSALVQSYFWGS